MHSNRIFNGKHRLFLKSVKITSLFLIITFICSNMFFGLNNVGYGVSGSDEIDYDAEIKALEEEQKAIAERIAKRQNEIEELRDDVEQQDYLMSLVKTDIEDIISRINTQAMIVTEMQNRITEKQIEIEALEQDILDTEFEIENKKDKIELLNKENEENIRQFGKIVRTLYMSNDFDIISMVMGASDFYDLFVRTEILQNVGERNTEFMNLLLASIEQQEELIVQLQEQELSLTNKKTMCQNEKSGMEGELVALQLKKDQLDLERNAEEQKLNKYASEKAELTGMINERKNLTSADQQTVEAINSEVAALIKEKQARAAATQKVYSADGFIWPLDNQYRLITTYFGYDAWRSGNHYGIDVGNSGIGGSNIYAVQSGTVIRAVVGDTYGGGYGNYIILDHGGGISTLYAHMQAWSPRFSEGDTVEQGDVLGLVGRTGWATGNHLHFEVRVNGTPVDPFNYNYS